MEKKISFRRILHIFILFIVIVSILLWSLKVFENSIITNILGLFGIGILFVYFSKIIFITALKESRLWLYICWSISIFLPPYVLCFFSNIIFLKLSILPSIIAIFFSFRLIDYKKTDEVIKFMEFLLTFYLLLSLLWTFFFYGIKVIPESRLTSFFIFPISVIYGFIEVCLKFLAFKHSNKL